MPSQSLIDELVTMIAGQLQETQTEPIEEIRRIVTTIGPEQAATLVRTTLRLDALGGLLRNDGQRRTPGGVFFSLAHGVANRRQRRQIWHSEQTKPAGDKSAGSAHSWTEAGFVVGANNTIIEPASTHVNAMEETRLYNGAKSPRRA